MRPAAWGAIAIALLLGPVAPGRAQEAADPDSTLEEWIDALPEGTDVAEVREALDGVAVRHPTRAVLSLVAGARRAARLRARWRGWSGLARASEAAGEGWRGFGGVAWSGRGWLESVVVGGLRPKLAEGALVGVRTGDYEPPRSAGGPGGLALRASATATAALVGAGAAVRAGRWRAAVAQWAPDGGEATPTGWATVARAGPGGNAGLAVGRVGGTGGGTPAGSVFASHDGEALGAAFEAAWLGGRGALVARAWSGGEAGTDWWVETFADGGGAGFGASVVGDDDFRSRRTGAAWHRALRTRRIAGRVSLYAVLRTRARDRRRRLRAQWEGRMVGGDGYRMDWLVRLDDERTLAYPALGDPPGATTARSGRARVRFTVDEGATTQRLELSVQASRDARPGAVVGWRATVGTGGLAATIAATAWALPSGETGYFARPGAAGYEILGVATRRGADFSARLSCRLGPGAVTLYAGGREGGEQRVLVSLDLEA